MEYKICTTKKEWYQFKWIIERDSALKFVPAGDKPKKYPVLAVGGMMFDGPVCSVEKFLFIYQEDLNWK